MLSVHERETDNARHVFADSGFIFEGGLAGAGWLKLGSNVFLSHDIRTLHLYLRHSSLASVILY